jgi:hypothetical protein
MPSKESIAVILGSIALGLRKKGSKNTPTPIETIDRYSLKNLLSHLGSNEYIHGTMGFSDYRNPILYRNPMHPPIFSKEQEAITPDMGIYITNDFNYPGFETNNMNYICIVEAEDSELKIDEDWLGDACIWLLANPELNEEPDKLLRSIGKRALSRFGTTILNKIPVSFNQYIKEFTENLKNRMPVFIEIEYAAAFGKRVNAVITPEETAKLIEWSEMGMLPSRIKAFFIPDPENKGVKPKRIFRIVD